MLFRDFKERFTQVASKHLFFPIYVPLKNESEWLNYLPTYKVFALRVEQILKNAGLSCHPTIRDTVEVAFLNKKAANFQLNGLRLAK